MTDIIIPDSKSEFIRVLLIASIFNKSVFNNQFVIKYHTELCDDVLATLDVLPIFGCKSFIDLANREIVIYPTNECVETVSVGESGTLYRILRVLQSEFDGIIDKSVNIITQGTLKNRTTDFNIFHLYVNNITHSIEYDANQSSQPVSGLIIGAVHEIVLNKYQQVLIKLSNISSKPYIELTIHCIRKLLNKFVSISFDNDTININKKNEFGPQPSEYTICGDATSTLALFSAGYWLRKSIRLWNMPKLHIPDFEILQKCCGKNLIAPHYFVFHWSDINGLEKDIDFNNNPDAVPYWCLMECKSLGAKSNIVGISRLVNKESNRLAVLRDILGEFGIEIDYGQERIHIKQTDKIHAPLIESKLDPHNDHRMAQIIAILSFALHFDMSNNLFKQLQNCVTKSYPNFLSDLTKINESK